MKPNYPLIETTKGAFGLVVALFAIALTVLIVATVFAYAVSYIILVIKHLL